MYSPVGSPIKRERQILSKLALNAHFVTASSVRAAVVDKLLTGFDAPSATYLYIDQKMRDHKLFQAICRVNRLDDESKEYGYVIDYRDLFQCLEKAVSDYTSGAFDAFEPGDVQNLIKTRTEEAETELITYLETLRALCEPVEAPRSTLEFIRYFVWKNDGDLDELDENKPKRLTLYTQTAFCLIRAQAAFLPKMPKRWASI